MTLPWLGEHLSKTPFNALWATAAAQPVQITHSPSNCCYRCLLVDALAISMKLHTLKVIVLLAIHWWHPTKLARYMTSPDIANVDDNHVGHIHQNFCIIHRGTTEQYSTSQAQMPVLLISPCQNFTCHIWSYLTLGLLIRHTMILQISMLPNPGNIEKTDCRPQQ